MSVLWVSPAITHELAAAVRLVDGFTGTPLRERYDVRISGQEWWVPLYREEDATYRFLLSNRPLPALGSVSLVVTSPDPGAAHADLGGLTLTIPGPAPPVPLTVGHFLVEHPLWPTRSFRPPPGETFIKGRCVRAGQPVAGQLVQIAEGAAPLPATPAARTDADGEFAYRLPDLRVDATTPGTVVDTADLHVAVADGGVAQVLTAPALPIVVPIGRTTAMTLVLA